MTTMAMHTFASLFTRLFFRGADALSPGPVEFPVVSDEFSSISAEPSFSGRLPAKDAETEPSPRSTAVGVRGPPAGGEPAPTGSQAHHRRVLPIVGGRAEIERGPVSAEFDPFSSLHVPARVPAVQIVGALRSMQIIGALRDDVQIVDPFPGDAGGPIGGVGRQGSRVSQRRRRVGGWGRHAG